MARRTYNRRSNDQIIQALQDRIKEIEKRIEAKVRPDTAVLKELPRLKRSLARFAQLCVNNRRHDLSNSVLAFMATLEAQARQAPAESAPGPRSRGIAEAV